MNKNCSHQVNNNKGGFDCDYRIVARYSDIHCGMVGREKGCGGYDKVKK